MVKQKHASLDKLLTTMLQQTSRIEESSSVTVEQEHLNYRDPASRNV